MIKNTLYTLSLSLLLITSLSARANPFIPTQEYMDAKNNLLYPQNIDDGDRTVKIIHNEKKPLEEIIVKKVIPVKKTEKPKEIKTYKYNLLSFVNINIANDIMNIKTKYKLKKYFIFKQENKFVFDFVGKKRFYTKRETLSSHKDFSRIIIGAHPEDYYFRVVVVPEYNSSEYKVTINENGLITIKRVSE